MRKSLRNITGLVIVTIVMAVMSVSLTTSKLCGAPIGGASLRPYLDTSLLGCDSLAIKKVTVSSSTATAVLTAKFERKGVAIKNITGGSYTVYLATYPAVSSNNLYPLSDGSEFQDDTMPYTGAWYVLGAPGISTSTVITIEKY